MLTCFQPGNAWKKNQQLYLNQLEWNQKWEVLKF